MFIAAWAHKRGFLTAKAGRPDAYRAGRFRKSVKEKTNKFQFQALSEPAIFNRDAAKWRDVILSVTFCDVIMALYSSHAEGFGVKPLNNVFCLFLSQ